MEQYMYTYLNQQYGLKSLILEWGKSILEGLEKYSTYDTEVALFGKILKNECDEEFHNKLDQTKESIYDYLKEITKKKFKYMNEGQIQKYVEDLSKGSISEEIWRELTRKVVNEFDIEVVYAKIMEKITSSTSSHEDARNDSKRRGKKDSENKIEFVDLQGLLLEYALAKHDIKIKKFVEIFRTVDEDTNGIIDDSEFLKMIAIMNININESVVNRLLSLLDPFKRRHIVFTECLTVFETVTLHM
jgi:hypothetical protein